MTVYLSFAIVTHFLLLFFFRCPKINMNLQVRMILIIIIRAVIELYPKNCSHNTHLQIGEFRI